MLQKITRRLVVATLCITMIFIGGGCTNNLINRNKLPSAPTSSKANMLVANTSTFSNVSVYQDNDGLVWVPMEQTAKSINLKLRDVDNRFQMGDTDPVCSVKVNQTEALSGDTPVDLPQAPKLFDKRPYMTTEALSALLGTPVNWDATKSEVIITPIDDGFLSQQQSGSDGQIRSLALTIANKSEVISFGEKFMGTPYKFSAGPYDRTQRFDCSSFVQYVFGHFGVRLPRSSRSQARVGTAVAASQLQTGDLMFFYTPGRFASNRIVGHVGIYAGNGKILHTYGKPGVTVTDFSKNWKKRFLFAKRVA